MITLQESYENGIYNPIKEQVYFYINMVKLYTDLKLPTDMDEFELFDYCYTNDIFKKILDIIPQEEYDILIKFLNDTEAALIKYNLSTAGIINNVIQDLPKNAAAAAKIVEEFDPKKYQAVVDFAKAANGGRAIPASK